MFKDCRVSLAQILLKAKGLTGFKGCNSSITSFQKQEKKKKAALISTHTPTQVLKTYHFPTSHIVGSLKKKKTKTKKPNTHGSFKITNVFNDSDQNIQTDT